MVTQEELTEIDVKIRAYLGKVLEGIDGLDDDHIDEMAYTISEIVLDVLEGVEE